MKKAYFIVGFIMAYFAIVMIGFTIAYWNMGLELYGIYKFSPGFYILVWLVIEVISMFFYGGYKKTSGVGSSYAYIMMAICQFLAAFIIGIGWAIWVVRMKVYMSYAFFQQDALFYAIVIVVTSLLGGSLMVISKLIPKKP